MTASLAGPVKKLGIYTVVLTFSCNIIKFSSPGVVSYYGGRINISIDKQMSRETPGIFHNSQCASRVKTLQTWNAKSPIFSW